MPNPLKRLWEIIEELGKRRAEGRRNGLRWLLRIKNKDDDKKEEGDA